MKSIIEKTLDTGKKIAMTAILTYGAIRILEDEEERSARIKESEKTKRKKSKYKNIDFYLHFYLNCITIYAYYIIYNITCT